MKRFLSIIGVMLILPVTLLVLVACDNGGLNTGYWKRDPAARLPTSITIMETSQAEIDKYCPGALGCTSITEDPWTVIATVRVLQTLEPPLKNCVYSHELMHVARFMHDGGETPGVECAEGRR